MKRLSGVVAAGLFVILLAHVFSTASRADSLRVGVIAPLTGPSARMGEELRRGLMLSARKLEPDITLNLVFEDSELQSVKAVSAYRKLRAEGELAAVIVFGGGAVAALAPLVNDDHVPTIAITASRALTRGKEHVLRAWISSEGQAQVLAREAVRRGYKRVAILLTAQEGCVDLAEKMGEALKKANIDVSWREQVEPTERDFRATAQRLGRGGHDALFIALLPPQSALLARQLKGLGTSKMSLLSIVNVEDSNEVAAAGGALDGTVYAGPPYSSDFLAAFKAAYGHSPEVAAALGFDIAQLLPEIRNRTSTTGQSRFQGIRVVSGAMGNYQVDDQGDLEVPAVLKVIRGADFELLTD